MKKIFFIVVIFVTISQTSFAQDSTKQSNISQLLSFYYNIKDALVAGNTTNAASNAQAFVKTENTIDHKVISEANINVLATDAGKISQANDISKQREYFAGLSSAMIAVSKSVQLDNKPVYEVYCPMKRSYWLSSEKAIQNPYFGSSMSGCGQVVGTLK